MPSLRPHQQLDRPLEMPYASVGALFAAQAEENKGKTFLICPGKQEERFSYQPLRSRYALVAEYLRRLGLKRGDRFSIVFPNSSEFLFFYFAGLTRGITVVPINPDLSPREMQYIIEDSA